MVHISYGTHTNIYSNFQLLTLFFLLKLKYNAFYLKQNRTKNSMCLTGVMVSHEEYLLLSQELD